MPRYFRRPPRPAFRSYGEGEARPFSRPRSTGPRSFAARLEEHAPPGSEGWPRPWVQMKYFSYAPAVFPRLIAAASPGVEPGDLVAVYDKEGQPFGTGYYNARARIPLRVLTHGPEAPDEAALEQALDRAVTLRKDILRLEETTEAWRVVHSDADGLGGLVVDKFADVLAVEVSNLGTWRRIEAWLPRLHAALGTRRAVVRIDPEIARLEGIDPRTGPALPPVGAVRMKEHGIRYGVDFTHGHKTGFFCDQRENRRRLGEWTRGALGRRVLDLCCYTGGFSLSAKITGSAEEVTGVDLDETAIAQAKANASLNQARIRWVHADAFDYARQMLKNGEQFSTVILDPPKFVLSRDEKEQARRKYNDLNALAVCLVEKGGLFVTCSCSGLLETEEFESLVIAAAHRHGRKLQILDRTGAGPDHPVMSNCPESRYLKVLWALVR